MALSKIALVIPDTHRPFHHRRAYALAIKIAKKLPRLDELIILGDYADFYGVQMHGPRHPGILPNLKEEIDDVNVGLDELDKEFAGVKKFYLEGNHEFRLERFLVQHALPLYGIYTVSSLFKMESRKNWTWVPYHADQRHQVLGSSLWARHEPFAPNPRLSVQRALVSHIYGHVHRAEESYQVGLDQKPRVAICPGWLGDKRMDVFRYLKQTPNWSLGLSLIHMDPASGWFHHEPIRIHEIDSKKGEVRAVWNGEIITG
jgi:Calcineurin-like phosphoesterase